MSSIHESSVFQTTYDLLKRIHIARKRFEKTEKYSLGQSFEEAALSTLEEIVEAGTLKREWKIAAINRALRQAEKTKILVRLASDLEQIGEREMISMQESIQKIGRMLGGWRRSI